MSYQGMLIYKFQQEYRAFVRDVKTKVGRHAGQSGRHLYGPLAAIASQAMALQTVMSQTCMSCVSVGHRGAWPVAYP